VNRIRAGTEAPASVKGSTVTAAPTDEPARSTCRRTCSA